MAELIKDGEIELFRTDLTDGEAAELMSMNWQYPQWLFDRMLEGNTAENVCMIRPFLGKIH